MMAESGFGTGSSWRYGLPPGVYEQQQQAPARRDVRMDIAAFIGLAERGPVACPVVLDSWDSYITRFGPPGGGRLLGDSVRLFFANGGQRCVVVRVLDYNNAAVAVWNIESLRIAATGLPVYLHSRNPGHWGNQLQIQPAFRLDTFSGYIAVRGLTLKNPAHTLIDAQQLILTTNSTPASNSSMPDSLKPGSLLVFRLEQSGQQLTGQLNEEGGEKENRLFFRFIRQVKQSTGELYFNDKLVNDKLHAELVNTTELLTVITLDKALPATLLPQIPDQVATVSASAAKSPDPKPLLSFNHVRLNLSIHLEQQDLAPVREEWTDLAFHPDHPRYFPRVLNHKSNAEYYVDDSDWYRFDLTQPSIERVDTEQQFVKASLAPELDERSTGSALLRFPLTEPYTACYPEPDHLLGQLGSDALWTELLLSGQDAAQTTRRVHFFTPPRYKFPPGSDTKQAGIYPFIKQAAPLQALAAYDERNITAPASLVALPDLLHPRQHETALALTLPEAEFTPYFDCYAAPEATQFAVIQRYPNLMLGSDGGQDVLRSFQQQLREYCEQQQDRIAILDLPPGLTNNQLISWHQAVRSERTAMYAPYLELAQNDNPVLIVPPCGAVCGLIAQQTRLNGVYRAPANLNLQAVTALHQPSFMPDEGFLYQQRINAIRATPQGLTLLSARTTAAAPQWTHLSVRRLIDYLERQLPLDLEWGVFEANTPVLWNRAYGSVDARLRLIFERGGFAGTSIEHSYFVRCDNNTNPMTNIDQGQLTVLVGIAPSVPAEFILFRLVQGGEDLLQAEEYYG